MCLEQGELVAVAAHCIESIVAIGNPERHVPNLRNVAASNNRDHPRKSLSSSPSATAINSSPGSQALLEVTHRDHSIGITLLLFVHATYIYILFFFTHIPFVVNHTFNATPPERLQQYSLFVFESFKSFRDCASADFGISCKVLLAFDAFTKLNFDSQTYKLQVRQTFYSVIIVCG